MSATAARLLNVDDGAIADNAGAEQSSRSARAHIIRVSGRNTEADGRGLPKVAEIEIATDDGRVLQACLPALQSVQSGTAALVRPIERATFRVCPICLKSTGDTKEHVPPKPLGGVMMTYTCSACNGGLDRALSPPCRTGSTVLSGSHTRARAILLTSVTTVFCTA